MVLYSGMAGPNPGHIRPKSGRFGWNRSNVGRHLSPNMAESSDPNSADLGVDRLNVAQSWARSRPEKSRVGIEPAEF